MTATATRTELNSLPLLYLAVIATRVCLPSDEVKYPAISCITSTSAWTPTFDGDGDANGVKEVSDRAINYLPDGAAYFSMSQFYGGAADEFGYLLKEYNAQRMRQPPSG